MAQTLGLRATSFMASAVLLGAAVVGAFSVSVTIREIRWIEPPIVPTEIEPPPSKPPPPIAREAPPPETPAQEPIATQPAEPPTHTLLPFTPPAGPPEITSPRWLRRPTNLAAYYPRRAVGREVEGEALLDCRVLTTGDLSCAIVSETPSGWGFGEAALRIARDHRMAPATRDGMVVEGRYRMRVPFELR